LLAPAQGPLAYQVLAGRPNPSDSEGKKEVVFFFSLGIKINEQRLRAPASLARSAGK